MAKYTMWDRMVDEERPMSQQALEKILDETDGVWTGPFGGAGKQIDLVMYVDTDDDTPSVAAVHVAPEIGGHWYAIPDGQDAFISHELSQNAYEE